MILEYILLFNLFSGVMVFCSTRKHLLLSLLSLEYMVLSVFFSLFLMMHNYGYDLYFTLLFLVFTVCEGALGLSILVSLVRNQGNDYLSGLSILSW
uniref:NADH dehydrogenase subunit 4L n=1 Tax=Picromerus lewisi TaxID=763226 RepID=UPI001D12FC0D|nr:NADH dehydrogenase subunit 4L [Picromerus lewisi]QZP40903.1 NADH dehydrogenase subunit 4L [Picromerus lewisi]URT60197.1 NADH dehydrogenase subunit 4L [Picromerus lewisi]UYG49493.1 NADH dehydrogenase subunit 4L [Picromerus lewisi]WQM56496.1 NADH dehydrogenase subunit 4L [Picromerus lewisi]